MSELQITYRSVDELVPYARNARTHSEQQIDRLAASIREYGWTNPILTDGESGIIAGHGRLAAARKLGIKTVPTIELSGLSEAQKRAYILADNRIALDAGWDAEMLKVELDDLQGAGIDLGQIGFTSDELDELIGAAENDGNDSGSSSLDEGQRGSLSERYGAPPFSVLDTRRGEWRDRVREWRELIQDEGESRESTLFDGETNASARMGLSSVSLLDPVLAELICKWFTPSEGAKCCDPFAGDTVFGYVSATLGHEFTGIELRPDQAELNNARVQGLNARYVCDDGQNIEQHIEAESQDLVFSCPPYFDLEKYSDLPNDASNQDWAGFCSILRNALTGAVRCLKPNRFAVVVMSNVRGADGFYLDICQEIKAIMADAGARLYNEIVLVNAVGSGAVRASRIFRTRKVVRLHQEVLVFYKGNPKEIQKHFPVIEVPDIVEDEA